MELLVGLAELEKLKTVNLIGRWSGWPVHRLTETKAAAVNAMCRILRGQRPIKKPDQTVHLSRTGCLSSLSSLPPEMCAGSEGMFLAGGPVSVFVPASSFSHLGTKRRSLNSTARKDSDKKKKVFLLSRTFNLVVSALVIHLLFKV